jgi:hypothetical protein
MFQIEIRKFLCAFFSSFSTSAMTFSADTNILFSYPGGNSEM